MKWLCQIISLNSNVRYLLEKSAWVFNVVISVLMFMKHATALCSHLPHDLSPQKGLTVMGKTKKLKTQPVQAHMRGHPRHQQSVQLVLIQVIFEEWSLFIFISFIGRHDCNDCLWPVDSEIIWHWLYGNNIYPDVGGGHILPPFQGFRHVVKMRVCSATWFLHIVLQF